MSRNTLIILLALIIVIGATVAFYMVESKRSVGGGAHATSSPSLVGQAIFSDGEHGFTLQYPDKDQTDFTFKSYYHLPAAWRVNALTNATGTPLISIIGLRIESDHAYPRYFDAEIRVGASKDPKEVAACDTVATSSGETALPDITMNGTTWKAFTFESAGMMQYLKGVSFRTVHDGSCIALEKLETGSSYKDDPASADDVPQATLDGAYSSLDTVLNTFTFVKP